MYNHPYFIPNYYSNMVAPSMIKGAMSGALRGANQYGIGRGIGLFGKLGNSFSMLKSINWGGLINNTSKTLGVVNQAIPLVRQVGPIFNNMKSMVRVASLFKDETDKRPHTIFNSLSTNNSNISSTNNSSLITEENNQSNNSYDYDDYSPTFFIGQ